MNIAKMKRSEDTEQIKLFNWIRSEERYQPELHWVFHIPNGGSRNQLEAKKLKAMGVMSGVSDICFPVSRGRYRQLWIEMKFGNNKPTERQLEFLQQMQAQGDYVCICYTCWSAKRVIQRYLGLTGDEKLSKDKLEACEYSYNAKWDLPVVK